ncbi:MAG TPA: hypothetical protein VMP10_02000 [Chloroflexota bacterium]|nr:hypothetical protein [Chloroflexota bacterium]
MENLWSISDRAAWHAALDRYVQVIAEQGSSRLPELDRWYREDLTMSLPARRPPHVTHAELVRVVEWKMARGVWRQRNLLLVRSNEPATVEQVSQHALLRIPDAVAPISSLARLAGVGPATASAIIAAAAPDRYPFFDEVVADQVPGLGKVAFTLGYYRQYADALRDRSAQLGRDWTPALVERALWSFAGGKAGRRLETSSAPT